MFSKVVGMARQFMIGGEHIISLKIQGPNAKRFRNQKADAPLVTCLPVMNSVC